jgi:hypothetical protein
MLNIYNTQNKSEDEPGVKKPPAAIVKPVQHVDYHKYKDASGELDSSVLGRGIWYVEHRIILYRVLLGTLGLTAIILWGYSLVAWGIFLLDWQVDTRMQEQLGKAQNYTLLAKRFAPTPLNVLSTGLLPGGTGKYDAVAEIANVNEHFLVTIEYDFDIGGTKTPRRTTTLLPGEERPVVELGIETADPSVPIALKIEAVHWKRISNHQVPKPIEWQAHRLDLALSNSSITNGQASDIKANIITFSLTNNSSYGYIQPSFYLGLYDRDTLVGVMPFSLPQLDSLQTVSIDLRNFVTNLSATDLKVFPLINLYDNASYLVPKP